MEKSIIRQNAIKAVVALVGLGQEKMEEDRERHVYGEPTNMIDLDEDFMDNPPNELQVASVLRDLGLEEIAPAVTELFRFCAQEREERDEDEDFYMTSEDDIEGSD